MGLEEDLGPLRVLKVIKLESNWALVLGLGPIRNSYRLLDLSVRISPKE